MLRIDWVVFDLGGVLLEVNQERIHERLSQLTGLSLSKVGELLRADPEVWGAFGVEEFTPGRLAREVNRLLSSQLTELQVVEAFNAELGPTIEGASDVVIKLKPLLKVACLSNTNSIHWEALHTHYEFMHFFDEALASQALGCAKPGEEIYKKAIKQLGVAPSRVLFFDDRIDNIEAATVLGWHARRCTGTPSLVEGLREFGLVGA